MNAIHAVNLHIMQCITHILLTLLLFTPVKHGSCEYITRSHNGFNYTYAGEEVGNYQESLDWCTRLGGQLPAVHSPADIDFLADDLIGEPGDHDSLWLGAGRFHDSWKWNDNSPSDIVVPMHQPPNNDYGIILSIGREEGKKLEIEAFADPTRRRMACRLTVPSIHSTQELENRLHLMELFMRRLIENKQEGDKAAFHPDEGILPSDRSETRSPSTVSQDMRIVSVATLTSEVEADNEHGRLNRWLIALTVFVTFNTVSLMLLIFHRIFCKHSKTNSG